MSRREIEQRARLVVALELGVAAERIRDNSDFRQHLGADSLDSVTLVGALEEEFGIQISDDEVDFAETFGTAVDIIAATIERGTSAPPFRRRAAGARAR